MAVSVGCGFGVRSAVVLPDHESVEGGAEAIVAPDALAECEQRRHSLGGALVRSPSPGSHRLGAALHEIRKPDPSARGGGTIGRPPPVVSMMKMITAVLVVSIVTGACATTGRTSTTMGADRLRPAGHVGTWVPPPNDEVELLGTWFSAT